MYSSIYLTVTETRNRPELFSSSSVFFSCILILLLLLLLLQLKVFLCYAQLASYSSSLYSNSLYQVFCSFFLSFLSLSIRLLLAFLPFFSPQQERIPLLPLSPLHCFAKPSCPPCLPHLQNMLQQKEI